MTELSALQHEYNEYCARRGWLPFHDLKSLTLALAAEVGELAHLIEWDGPDQLAELAAAPASPRYQEVAGELADVFIYTLCIANALGIQLEDAYRDKYDEVRRRSTLPRHP